MTTFPTDHPADSPIDDLPAGGGPAPATAAPSIAVFAERLDVGTEWTETGRVRLHRRVVTETRTVEVTVRREELVIDTDNVQDRDGVLVGTVTGGQVAARAQAPAGPLVLALREEVAEVQLTVRPYELVTVNLIEVAESVQVSDQVRHEEVAVDASGAAPGPTGPAGTSTH